MKPIWGTQGGMFTSSVVQTGKASGVAIIIASRFLSWAASTILGWTRYLQMFAPLKRARYGTNPAEEFSHALQRSYLLRRLTHYCYLLCASTSSRWHTYCVWFFVRVHLTSIPIYPFQVKLFSELGKIEGSLQELHKMKPSKDISQYSIEVIELF